MVSPAAVAAACRTIPRGVGEREVEGFVMFAIWVRPLRRRSRVCYHNTTSCHPLTARRRRLRRLHRRIVVGVGDMYMFAYILFIMRELVDEYAPEKLFHSQTLFGEFFFIVVVFFYHHTVRCSRFVGFLF